jgi:hypothetical protein
MIPVEQDLPDHISGSTFKGAQFTMTVNESLSDLTGATIEMDVRKTYNADPVLELTTESSGGITLSDPANGEFQIDEQDITIDPGLYMYDIKITYSGGDIKTYVKGKWKITPKVTE